MSSHSKSKWQLNIYSSYRDLSETLKAAIFVTGVKKKKSDKQDNPVWSLSVELSFFYCECFPGRWKKSFEWWMYANIIKDKCCVCVLWLSFGFLLHLLYPIGMGSRCRNRICIYINDALAAWRKVSLSRAQCRDGIFCLTSRFGLDNRNDVFYWCGPENLLSIFTPVPSFDLHSNLVKLAKWALLFSFCQWGNDA